MLEKEPGVLVALPFGDTSHVEVWASKRGALNKKSAKKLIELDKDFKVIGFQRRDEKAGSPAKAKAKAKAKKKVTADKAK